MIVSTKPPDSEHHCRNPQPSNASKFPLYLNKTKTNVLDCWEKDRLKRKQDRWMLSFNPSSRLQLTKIFPKLESIVCFNNKKCQHLMIKRKQQIRHFRCK